MTYSKPCPSCAGPKAPRHYMCPGCWPQLSAPARAALGRGDRLSVRRLAELLEQLRNDVPLAEVVITP